MVYETLTTSRLSVRKPKASFYVWCKTPEGHTSASFTSFLLEKAAVIVTPGSAYGHHGEGYVRLSLTVPDNRLESAMERIRKAMGK